MKVVYYDEEKSVAEAIKEMGRTRLSINFVELFTSLFAQGKADWFGMCYTYTVPPNYTLTFIEYAPKNEVSIPFAVKLWTSLDGVIKYYLYIDNKLRFYDNAVTDANYPNYFNFLQVGALFAGKVEKRVVQNTSSSSVTFSEFIVYARISDIVWRKLMEKYFDVIVQEVGLV